MICKGLDISLCQKSGILVRRICHYKDGRKSLLILARMEQPARFGFCRSVVMSRMAGTGRGFRAENQNGIYQLVWPLKWRWKSRPHQSLSAKKVIRQLCLWCDQFWFWRKTGGAGLGWDQDLFCWSRCDHWWGKDQTGFSCSMECPSIKMETIRVITNYPGSEQLYSEYYCTHSGLYAGRTVDYYSNHVRVVYFKSNWLKAV